MRRLIVWILTAFVPAAIAAPFPARGYYAGLRKPSWSPPGWLFGPVWTVLYAAMGIAAWLVGERGGREARPALVLWFGQLLLNAAWTPVFFGLRAPGAALATITALWVAIVATTIAFVRRRPAAGMLLLPYLAWVTFAGLLNLEIWRRNR
jgi:translocator protein